MKCQTCAADVTGKRFCTNCGTAAPLAGPTLAPPNTQGAPGSYIRAPGAIGSPYHFGQPSDKRLPAGLCGIFLGGLGIHKFVLGYTNAGIIMLVIGFFSCGIISGVIGLIEGIIYLTKSDQEFDAVYVRGKKEWF